MLCSQQVQEEVIVSIARSIAFFICISNVTYNTNISYTSNITYNSEK